ncbi:hypothetical protein [Streptomyces vinaceus]|uniref:hypothetical protein n=1 Tax=Streptomyces vinaceus TaxID=1960 RepID=UPI0036A3B453
MRTTEYGIASESQDDIETLGTIGFTTAKTILNDSRNQWPDVYLVQRVNGGDWQRLNVREG